MIRFIRLGSQINEGANQFAFFDTVPDRFVSVGGQQVFDDEQDFNDAGCADPGLSLEDFGRLTRLIPEEFGGPS